MLAKWKNLTQGCFSISYSIDGHPNCILDCNEDLSALYAPAVTFGIGRVDVVVKESIGYCLGFTVDDGSSSSMAVVAAEVISDVVDGDMISSFCEHGSKELKSDAWRKAINCVDQVFVGGAAAFRDSLCKYSLFHGFKFIYIRNDSERVAARCQSMKCTWFVKANIEKPSGLFRIKEFINEHCCGANVLSTSSSGLIGRLFSETIRLTPSKRPVDVKKELKLKYGVDHMGGLETKRKKHIMALFHRCAYAPTVTEFDKLLSKLKADGGQKVIDFLSTLANDHWCHPYFVGKRYGELTSNLVESFNSWIKKERHLPITQLVDRIRVKLMDQMSDRRDLGLKWETVICPKKDRKLGELFTLSKTWNVVRSNDELYEVHSNPSVSVHIGRRTCSCGEWQINSFPCVHALCALKRSKRNLNDYLERYYFTETYQEV
ncbi:hypothetical protein Vadar_002666 [Vaccinium darrowii]|uniref:Uncharacterized protein n=1 Tax=Vaccinium darrowii TaxID=229202 RepID=A0ACB7YCQ6_9ERIC|nr:hypothetical protein Vadar_002666 [Vaccinium darrowii]